MLAVLYPRGGVPVIWENACFCCIAGLKADRFALRAREKLLCK